MIVRTPYRWLWRTWRTNLAHWCYDIRNGVGNLFTFFNAVWWFRPWDWSGMVNLLRVSAEQMARSQAQGMHVGAESEARRLRVVAALCRRLLADEYFANAGYGPKEAPGGEFREFRDGHQIGKHAVYMSNQDANYLGKMLRFVQHWWD